MFSEFLLIVTGLGKQAMGEFQLQPGSWRFFFVSCLVLNSNLTKLKCLCLIS